MNDTREPCVFCDIVAGTRPASIVVDDATTLAFVDLRQYHPGHVLVVSRAHVPDIRAADDATAAAVLRTVARVARAVERVFPSDGLSVWHSAGAGANQEIPHLHFHVHPRYLADDVLRVYPAPPDLPDRATLDSWAVQLRAALDAAHAEPWPSAATRAVRLQAGDEASGASGATDR